MNNQDQTITVTSEDLDSEPVKPAAEDSKKVATPSETAAAPESVPTSPAPVEPAAEEATGKKILIVEDEKPLAKALETKLEANGFNALAVFNGQEALDELAKNTYDLVLLDLLMPNMDGWDLLAGIKEKSIATTAIILSNLGQSEDLTKAKELGAKDFWIKSDLSLAEIVARVSEELA